MKQRRIISVVGQVAAALAGFLAAGQLFWRIDPTWYQRTYLWPEFLAQAVSALLGWYLARRLPKFLVFSFAFVLLAAVAVGIEIRAHDNGDRPATHTWWRE